MLLLKILALEPMNGFAVSQRLKQVSGDVLQASASKAGETDQTLRVLVLGQSRLGITCSPR
jgi:hypothetical protein